MIEGNRENEKKNGMKTKNGQKKGKKKEKGQWK